MTKSSGTGRDDDQVGLRHPPAGRREPEAATEQLEDLYAHLTALSCLGLREASCGQHIDASTAERARLLDTGVDLNAPTSDGACPALTRTFGAGRCSVHAIRPTICRLWGAMASMPCPHALPFACLARERQLRRRRPHWSA